MSRQRIGGHDDAGKILFPMRLSMFGLTFCVDFLSFFSVWRVEWAAFLNRYKLLSLRTWPNYNPDASEEACKFVLEDADIASEKYAIGKKSKVFIKDHFTVERLEELRRHARERIIIAIQKPARGYTHRR